MTKRSPTMSRLPEEAIAGMRGVSPDHPGRSSTTWQSVRNAVLTRIRSQEWAAGALIPTEKQLATEWGCARATVNRALRDLADSGIVERRRKVGTRVSATPTLKANREISTIRNDVRDIGAAFSYRQLVSERISAPADVARQLQLSTGDPVLYISALFMADQAPYCCQDTWLNLSKLPQFDDHTDLSEVSAAEWLEHVAQPNHAKSAILSLSPTRDCADAMNIQPGTSVLTIERTDWADTTPLAFSRQFFPPGHRLVYDD